MANAQSAADRMKLLMGFEPKEPDFFEGLDECVTLSKEQRLYGFLFCAALGIFLSLMSSLFIFNLGMFAFFYTLGNIISLFSTAFLVGPYQQLENMFTVHRLAATCIYLFSLVMTLVVVIGLGNAALALICIFIQSLALVWYCLSYIPYARNIVKKTVGACCGVDIEF
mmetsp:Transcript_18552/g.25715  ORF Transcript_18552/g.25715 Transcript_18552/m.25715 type:complete len:168 (+) Transcript_18552:268-771(+)